MHALAVATQAPVGCGNASTSWLWHRKHPLAVTPQAPFGRDISIADDGTIVGGTLCTLALRNSARVVPDIHTVFGGNLHVFTSACALELPASEEGGGGTALRDTLLDDYVRKDAEVRSFATTRRFRHVQSAEQWVKLPTHTPR